MYCELPARRARLVLEGARVLPAALHTAELVLLLLELPQELALAQLRGPGSHAHFPD